jgi:hypothetical protein
MLRPYVYSHRMKPNLTPCNAYTESAVNELATEFPDFIYFYDEDDMETFLKAVNYDRAIELLKYAQRIRVFGGKEALTGNAGKGSQAHWDASCEAFLRSVS